MRLIWHRPPPRRRIRGWLGRLIEELLEAVDYR